MLVPSYHLCILHTDRKACSRAYGMGGALLSISVLLCLLFYLPTANLQEVTASSSGYETFSIPSFFQVANDTALAMLKDAGNSQGALQLTPDTAADLVNKSGRILFTTPFKLWDGDPKSNTSVASFHTDFNINIYRINRTIPGEGFAFIIVPSLEGPPPGSERGYLGLTNSTLDGNPDNQLVAIEFDTFKESYDPSDNHVGLDVNSVHSAVAVDIGIPIAPVSSTYYTVWVDYDGAERRVSVYMDFAGTPKPLAPLLSASLDLSRHVRKYSYFGFAASTGNTYQLNCVLSWNMYVKTPPSPKAKALGLILGVTLSSAALALAGLLVALCVINRKRREREQRSEMVVKALRRLPGMPREFDMEELKNATDNFDEKTKLGQGGYGVVYRGVLPGVNTEVAVKKFLRDKTKGLDDFLSELTVINRLRHKNLVPLLGWCHKHGVLLLVYEFMSNGSLDQHLFGVPDVTRPVLGWYRRYNIIADVASAIHYLHHEYHPMVVHRDIKASNIMLDAAFTARLGDFGLARTLDAYKSSFTDLGVVGTRGYIANECCITHKFTRESDVYAFGAVILEVVCGRRPLCRVAGFNLLVDWVWGLHGEGRILEAVDGRLAGEYVVEDAERLLLLGLACSHPLPGARLRTHAIMQVISKSVPPPDVPVIKPAFVWPPEGQQVDGDAIPSTSGGEETLTESNGSAMADAKTTPGSSLEVQAGWSSVALDPTSELA